MKTNSQNTKLEGGRTYHVHSVDQKSAEDFLRELALMQTLQFAPFLFDKGDRETVEKVRAVLAIEYAAPTVFFIASDKPYTNDSQALLLKVLENLHHNTIAVLHTRTKDDILETIQSRSIPLHLDIQNANEELETLSKQFLQAKPDKRLSQLAQFVGEDDEAPKYAVDDLVKQIETQLAQSAAKPDLVYIAGGVLKLFHEARNLRTIPPKTLFEYLAVSLPVL